ncbi:MAG: heavy-metal-associated domain-containing protein [Casimicrobiaceae bacterium]
MQTELLRVSGMTCGGCVSSVTHALQAVTGVGDVKVSLSAGVAEVHFDEGSTSPEQLKSAVKGAGYGVDAADAAKEPEGKGCCGD